ncbi:hypothetical protein RHSIM_Rhsim02G0249600 [Rhododendron simsii]|uniref:KIB1-4 beta-propeller domain-containing protein n=1 Tax=Rhododendron simsii TaxID=118357 RepID=A0A834LY38_RHOSS|nr:hypothetical protein RHSIM_Rhsim02G0249600 [Rhododendron simsii]
MGNWDELQSDLVVLVAKRIGLLEDFLAFGGVCRSWRSAAAKENFKGRPQVPWLMLPEEEEEGEKKSDERRFVSLTKGGMIRRFDVPEAKGKRCVETLGWFVTMSEQGEMSLIHPMSRVKIDLPHHNTFKYAYEDGEEDKRNYLQKAVLSSCPSSTDDYVLVVICGAISWLSFWRPGDKLWTTIETRNGVYYDVTYFKGQFYGVNPLGKVFRCGVGGPDPTLAWLVGAIPSKTLGGKRTYLVELSGRLLLVVRDGCDLDFLPGYVDDDDDTDSIIKDESTVKYGATEFQVFEVDINSNWTWAQITSLGDYALFLGDNASMALDVSKFVGVKPNCIYYTDDNWEAYHCLKRGGGKDMGIYNLEDRTQMPHYNGKECLSRVSPPIWVTPSFF